VRKNSTFSLLAAVALFALSLTTGIAAEPRVLIFTTENRQYNGTARWMPVQKQFLVTYASGGPGSASMTVELSPSQVAWDKLRVAKPDNWDALGRAVSAAATSGDKVPAKTLTDLEGVMKDYGMLEYDVLAARELMRIHLRENRAANAMKVADELIFVRPDAASATEAAPFIWEAMLQTKKTDGLEALLSQAVQRGSRAVAAQASLMRGDLLKAEGRDRDALKDGYLRVITLFKDQRTIQPEAHYKAALAFDALQEVQYAERMRQELLKKYADSPEAQQLRGK